VARFRQLAGGFGAVGVGAALPSRALPVVQPSA
jgi:hypothetical protein